MAKKGGTKKKSGKKKSSGDSGLLMASANFTPPPAEVFQRFEERWILVRIKLVTWSYLNFDLRLPETTNLYIVEQKIVEHHGGSINRLTLWKDQVHPQNVLRDFSKTL